MKNVNVSFRKVVEVKGHTFLGPPHPISPAGMIHSWCPATARLLFLAAWLASGRIAATDDPTSQCVNSASRQIPYDLATRLCSLSSEGLDDGPARCAAAAIRTCSSIFSCGTNRELANDVVTLCERAADTQPAECWGTAVSSGMHQSTWWRSAVINVCKSAASTLPADCLSRFKRHGITTTGSPTRQEAIMDVVVEICKDFRGDVSAIGTCLAGAPRSLPEISRYKLCRHGNETSVGDVVSCAKQLLQRNVKPEIVAQVCASASSSSDQPQECVLVAQQQLRWMDGDIVAYLCEHSRATADPVQCVLALRPWFLAQFTREQPLLDLARLCRGTRDADAIVSCVKRLPNQLFTAKQVVHLCAYDGSGDSNTRVECVLGARQQLDGLSPQNLNEIKRAEHAELLLAACESVSAHSTPLKCLASTASQSPPFTAQERVRLCQHAVSSVPYQCFRAIHVSVLNRFQHRVADGIELCRGATSLAPAMCVNQLVRTSTAFIQSGLASELCKNATSETPASCYAAAPRDFSDEEKVMLCKGAESDESAACAKVFLPRVNGNMIRAQLCSKAKSVAPARCASACPFGMGTFEIVILCREALDDTPAQCARVVPAYLKVPWRDVALACQGAVSNTPGSCLVYRVRQRVALTNRVISECRSMAVHASSIEIVQFAYECPELMPRCSIILKARVLDQFGDEMPGLNNGYVHFAAIPHAEEAAKEPVLRGVTIAPVVNGSVVFRDLHFTIAGNFTLRLSSTGVEDMIAQLHVRTNETERHEREHCDRIFSYMQCGLAQPSERDRSSIASLTTQSGNALQILKLPNQFVLSSLQCDTLWSDQHVGLAALGLVSNAKLFALPQMNYRLLTGQDIPSATMSPWECLGIPEGSNRSTIRHAYHRRSLEWHPDKWPLSGDSTSIAALRGRVEEVYARINNAYQQLFQREATIST